MTNDRAHACTSRRICRTLILTFKELNILRMSGYIDTRVYDVIVVWATGRDNGSRTEELSLALMCRILAGIFTNTDYRISREFAVKGPACG